MATETILSVTSDYPAPGSYELIRIVEEGLPLDCLEKLKQRGLTFTEIGQLVIPPRTLKHRRSRGERLSTEESERFLRVMRVLDLGVRVFGNRNKLLGWMRDSDERTENRNSLELLETDAGAQLVESQLWGIAEGVYN